MIQEKVALIPVREGSQRVKFKNFKNFINDKSLLQIKIDQLKKSNCFDKIYISSDNKQAEQIAYDNNINFLYRDKKACQADIKWSEALNIILNTIPGNPIVTWALTTSPLFNNFKKTLNTFLNNPKNDSLLTVFPKKSFFMDEKGRCINYNPGIWHSYSQDLQTYYEVTGACYIGSKNDMLKWNYWFGPNPYLFKSTRTESIDIDTLSDFKFAQKIYNIENA